MQDDEGGEQPGDERVERPQERQPAHRVRRTGKRCAPHQQSREDLERQEHVENGKVGQLLERVELAVGRLFEGMLTATEDTVHIVTWPAR